MFQLLRTAPRVLATTLPILEVPPCFTAVCSPVRIGPEGLCCLCWLAVIYLKLSTFHAMRAIALDIYINYVLRGAYLLPFIFIETCVERRSQDSLLAQGNNYLFLVSHGSMVVLDVRR